MKHYFSGLLSQEHFSLLEVEAFILERRGPAVDLVRREGELGENRELVHHDDPR